MNEPVKYPFCEGCRHWCDLEGCVMNYECYLVEEEDSEL